MRMSTLMKNGYITNDDDDYEVETRRRRRKQQQTNDGVIFSSKEDSIGQMSSKMEISRGETSSNMGEVDSLGVMIRPNVIVERDETFDLEMGSIRSKKMRRKRKQLRNFQILPLDHDSR